MVERLQKFIKRIYKSGVLYILVGGIIFLFAASWRFYSIRSLSFSGKDPVVTSLGGKKPVSISISSLEINLNIEEGSISDGVWEVSDVGGTHLDSSVNPGQVGNIVIYAHNKKNLFGPIRWIQLESTIKIVDEDGVEYRYTVKDTKEVKPDEMEYVGVKDVETLTLYTCSGLFDSKRFIVIAYPEGKVLPE